MNYVCFSGLALSDPEAQTENCFMFIGTRWMWSNIRHVFQSVIIFCRFHSCDATWYFDIHNIWSRHIIAPSPNTVNWRTLLSRFIYVRYASGLVKEGGRLLHQVILLYLTCQIMIWYTRFFYDFLYLSNYMDSIKFKFCEMQNISAKSEEDFKAFSLKPKLILIVLSLIYFSCFTYAYFGALNSRWVDGWLEGPISNIYFISYFIFQICK